MDRYTAMPFTMLDPEAADPSDRGGHVVRPLASRDPGTQVDQGMTSRIALPVPGSSPSDGHLELDHRLEPVDVGTFKEAGLDQAHGSRRIARSRRLDCSA